MFVDMITAPLDAFVMRNVHAEARALRLRASLSCAQLERSASFVEVLW